MMENPVDVIEDVPLGDFLVGIVLAEMLKRRVRAASTEIGREGASSDLGCQIERQIAYVSEPAALDECVEHFLLILVP